MKWLARINRGRKRGSFYHTDKRDANNYQRCAMAERPEFANRTVPVNNLTAKAEEFGAKFTESVSCNDFLQAEITLHKIMTMKNVVEW